MPATKSSALLLCWAIKDAQALHFENQPIKSNRQPGGPHVLECLPPGAEHGAFSVFAIHQHVGTGGGGTLANGFGLEAVRQGGRHAFGKHLGHGCTAVIRKPVAQQSVVVYDAVVVCARFQFVMER